ncbi:MAG: pitrilysin family protein [Thermoanaerobaculia bacterium]
MRLARTLLVLLLISNAAAAEEIVNKLTFPRVAYGHRTLPNGLEVYTIQDRSTPTVAIHTWYRVGSKDDPQGRSGFAHLFEHIMFKSTKNMPAEMMDRLTEDVGGWNNASTYDDFTAYYEVVPSNYLETLLWAEADRMGGLKVDEGNFTSERDVVKEEFRFRILAPPYGRLFYAIEKSSFRKHPYRRPGIGSIEELDAATIEDVRGFHRTFYRPDNAVLIIAGDFDLDQANGWIDRYFAPIPKPEGAIPRVDVAEPARVEEKRVDEYAPNVALPAVAMTWLAPPARHEDAPALNIAAAILGEGESSRLEERLVRGEIAQTVMVGGDLRHDLGLFTALAIMASGHQPAEAEKILREEMKRLGEKPIAAAELDKAKNLILTGALRQRETSNGKAFALGESLMLHASPEVVNTGLGRLQAVTAADVQRVIRKYVIDAKPVVITYRDESQRPGAKATEGGNQ